MPTPLKKQRSSPKPSEYSPSKRRRKASVEADVIVISDSDNGTEAQEDTEFKDILAQIEVQERSERYAKQLQEQFDLDINEDNAGPQGSSAQAPIDVDDAGVAQRLAEKWAAEDGVMSIRSFAEIDDHSSDIEIIDELPTKQPRASLLGKGRATAPSGSSAHKDAALITPDESLLAYRPIFVDSRLCSKCSKPMILPKGMVSFVDSLCPQSLTQILHIVCRSCKTGHCRGCFRELSCPITCKGVATNPDCTVHICCPEIRAIAVFAILEAFDTNFIQETVAGETRTQKLLQKNAVRKVADSVGPGGTGYATGRSGGRGRKATTSQRAYMDRQDFVIQAFKMLLKFLPDPYSDDPQEYDILPHASIGHLIALSQLPATLANLLRNDSVSDWIAQKQTYNTMLTLLRRMADSELTIQCLIGPWWEANRYAGLGNWMRNREKIVWKGDDEGKPDAQPPLYTHFRKLTLQSEAFLKGAQQMLNNGDSESELGDVIQGTSLAGDIIAARDDLERAISFIGRTLSPDAQKFRSTIKSAKNKGKGRAVPSDPDTLYLEACEKLAFKYISLASEQASTGGGLHYAHFNYAKNLKETENSMRHPKDRLHLVKELAVTATSLPAGIWVRVDEVRNDAVKIMMAGPAGTPYAGGLFEFDCFMPIGYPNQPPLVHLRTTGGGSVRFNPNLYNCGKVCLSLLGTWPGRPEERWTSKSTLLQVLVSIQSMILVEAPYFNEPGHGAVRVNLNASVCYNRNICTETVCWAIVEWLKDDHRNGIWRDVIASHFMIHKIKIRQQIVDWIASAPEIRAYFKNHSSYNYHVSGHNAGAYLHNSAARRDLLAEFDKGMKLIELWKTGYGWL